MFLMHCSSISYCTKAKVLNFFCYDAISIIHEDSHQKSAWSTVPFLREKNFERQVWRLPSLCTRQTRCIHTHMQGVHRPPFLLPTHPHLSLLLGPSLVAHEFQSWWLTLTTHTQPTQPSVVHTEKQFKQNKRAFVIAASQRTKDESKILVADHSIPLWHRSLSQCLSVPAVANHYWLPLSTSLQCHSKFTFVPVPFVLSSTHLHNILLVFWVFFTPLIYHYSLFSSVPLKEHINTPTSSVSCPGHQINIWENTCPFLFVVLFSPVTLE